MTAKLQNYIIQVEFYSSIYNAIIKLSSSHQNYHKHKITYGSCIKCNGAFECCKNLLNHCHWEYIYYRNIMAPDCLIKTITNGDYHTDTNSKTILTVSQSEVDFFSYLSPRREAVRE